MLITGGELVTPEGRRWPVVYTALVSSGLMMLERALRLVTAGPAEVFGLAPSKGALRVRFEPDFSHGAYVPRSRWRGRSCPV